MEKKDEFEEEGEDQICEECTGALESFSNQLRNRTMIWMVHLMRQSPVDFPVPPKRPVVVKTNDAKRSCKACNAKGRSCF